MNLAQIIASNKSKILLSQKDKNKFINITKQIETLETTNLNEIKGVGESTIKQLLENGINDKETLIKKGIEGMKLNVISKRALLKFIKQ